MALYCTAETATVVASLFAITATTIMVLYCTADDYNESNGNIRNSNTSSMESHQKEGGGNSTTQADASTSSTECATGPNTLQSRALSTIAHAQSPSSDNSASRSTAVSPDNTSVHVADTAAAASEALGSASSANQSCRKDGDTNNTTNAARASHAVTVVEIIDLSSDTEENNGNGDQSESNQQRPSNNNGNINSSSTCRKLKRKRRLMEQRKQNEQKAMLQSLQGRAFFLVERLIQVRKNTLLEILAASHKNKQQPKQHGSPTLVGHDDMVWLAERFFVCQQDFKALGKPTQVTLAYHYTSVWNLQSIRQGGLLSHPEQQQPTTMNSGAVTPNTSKRPGAFFGQGIYVSNNPYIFAPYYGDTCLLVAVLKGHQVRVEKGGTNDPAVDTALGNKTNPKHPLAEESILQQASQCLPILRFPRTFLYPNGTLDLHADALIRTFYEKVQQVLDEFLNENIPTVTRPHLPTPSLMTLNRAVDPPTVAAAASTQATRTTAATANGQAPSAASPPIGSTFQQLVSQRLLATHRSLQGNATTNGQLVTNASLLNNANSGLTTLAQQLRTTAATKRSVALAKPLERLPYTAPPQLATVETCSRRVRTLHRAANCSICSQSLMLSQDKGRVVQLDKAGCFHMFHEQCLGSALERDIHCPTCHLPVTRQGTSPSGVLTIAHTTALCGGYTQIDSNANSGNNGGPTSSSTTSSNGSIVLVFTFPSGIQQAYHQTPGLPYLGTTRTAYLPNNAQGRALLARMKHAWARGLFFAIGTSQATRKSGVIVWGSSVEFKSQLRGRYGFPDVDYIARVNSALDALQVPP